MIFVTWGTPWPNLWQYATIRTDEYDTVSGLLEIMYNSDGALWSSNDIESKSTSEDESISFSSAVIFSPIQNVS